jgi:hypothetical protein
MPTGFHLLHTTNQNHLTQTQQDQPNQNQPNQTQLIMWKVHVAHDH